MAEDINQVKLRWTVTETYFMQTAKGHDRLTFTTQLKTEYVDTFGDTCYSTTFITCVAWGKAASIFSKQLKAGTRVQLIGELNTYTTPSKKDPSIMLHKAEIRTQKIEVIGFDDTYVPRNNTGKVEFSITDDFSDLIW